MEVIVTYLQNAAMLAPAPCGHGRICRARGGLLDLFPSTLAEPIRLDFFGDTIETIRAFDPETQRSTSPCGRLKLVPMSEFQLTTDSIKRFRQAYVAASRPRRDGSALRSDLGGAALSGAEHWLPLFHERLDNAVRPMRRARASFSIRWREEAAGERLTQIADYHDHRKIGAGPGQTSGAPTSR